MPPVRKSIILHPGDAVDIQVLAHNSVGTPIDCNLLSTPWDRISTGHYKCTITAQQTISSRGTPAGPLSRLVRAANDRAREDLLGTGTSLPSSRYSELIIGYQERITEYQKATEMQVKEIQQLKAQLRTVRDTLRIPVRGRIKRVSS